jgi:hypothetical protein
MGQMPRISPKVSVTTRLSVRSTDPTASGLGAAAIGFLIGRAVPRHGA